MCAEMHVRILCNTLFFGTAVHPCCPQCPKINEVPLASFERPCSKSDTLHSYTFEAQALFVVP